jgi:uncharacterized protein (DUF1501 family)
VSLTRRDLIKCGAAGVASFLVPGAVRMAKAGGSDSVVVSIFLRGAADGLSLVVPHGDPAYYEVRPRIHVPAGDEIDLDGFYGLHPALAPLQPHFEAGRLAVIHAVGSPDLTRSHFDAQQFMDTGQLSSRFETRGWLDRFLVDQRSPDHFGGISIGSAPSPSLRGPHPTLDFASVTDFGLRRAYASERRAVLESLYRMAPGSELGAAADGAFAVTEVLARVEPSGPGLYPETDFGRAMGNAAALIKADLGVRAICVDLGGWDHHSQGRRHIGPVASDLASSLAAFHTDLEGASARTLTLVMTEFGRTARENASGGTDHGHGSVMLALGGGVSGGRVLTAGGTWPGLAPENLHEGRDLAVTTDFRDVFAEILDRHLGVASPSALLPGFAVDRSFYPGLFA